MPACRTDPSFNLDKLETSIVTTSASVNWRCLNESFNLDKLETSIVTLRINWRVCEWGTIFQSRQARNLYCNRWIFFEVPPRT